MNLTSAILQRPKPGVKRPKAASFRHSTFGFRHFSSPLSPQTHSHPAPRPGPTRLGPLKSNFLADRQVPPVRAQAVPALTNAATALLFEEEYTVKAL
jgi:hypothetical protein